MSDRTEFDDQARRKLEERAFPFDPAAWADMEPMLPQQHRRRRWAWPLLAAALLVPMAGGLWYAAQEDAPTTVAVPTAVPTAPATPNVVTDHADVTATPTAQTITEAHTTPTGSTAPAEPSVRPRQEHTASDKPAHNTHTPPLAERHATTAQLPSPARHVVHTTIAKEQHKEQHHAGSKAPQEDRQPVSVTNTPVSPTPQGSSDVTASDQDDQAQQASAPPPDKIIANDASTIADPLTTAYDQEPVSNDLTTSNSTAATPAGEEHAQGYTTDTTAAHAWPSPASFPDSLSANVIVPKDSSRTDSLLYDSASTAYPPLPTHPQWELGLWAGAFNTHTSYSGSRTADWATDHAGRNSIGFGAELVRMGDHFGYGSGLHYISYAERVAASGLTSSQIATVWSHHLMGVDTTILVTNGTAVINGQTYYVTYSLDTTIMVLVSTSEEETVTTVRRNALERTNRTSYLEIPLLLDAHTGAGRWLFGVRGGPTVGVLQGRRGQLPGAAGYTDLQDEAFHELVFGWTAQGYVRYQLGEAWSIGVGPSARGQLGNTMQGNDLMRRSAAWGGVFGIAYRLP